MTLDEKVGQLFVLMRTNPDPEAIKKTLATYHQGGLRWQGGDRNAVYAQNKTYQENSRIPLLIAANCDNGGDGCMPEGTYVVTAAEAAAGGDVKTAYDMGYVAGREASSVGVNWMFNPCADIFMNWRNTIVNTRSFGDNADQVIGNIRAFIDGIHQSNVACCCKHFPGDGVEERDQHLVLGVNDLSVEEWDQSFRKVYQTMIDEGLESIMVGYIALPEMSRKLRPGIKDEDIMPATLAPELLTDLLRGEMGFNGVVITDASHMADPQLKEEVVGCEEHLKLAEEAANRCITLVRDTRHILPINPEKQKRARLVFIQSTPTTKAYTGDPVKNVMIEELERAGFTVDVAPNFHDLEVAEGPSFKHMMTMMDCGKMEDFRAKYDVVFLVINVKGYAQENEVRLRWSCNHSSELPWYVTEVPTIGISLNYTTHLIDVPQVHTFVNAYGNTRTCIRTALEKICGKSEFTGTASETVFCGKWDTRL